MLEKKEGDPKSDYINASYIPVSNAAPTPLPIGQSLLASIVFEIPSLVKLVLESAKKDKLTVNDPLSNWWQS